MSEFVSEEDRVCWEKDLINYRYIKNFKPQIWTISKIWTSEIWHSLNIAFQKKAL